MTSSSGSSSAAAMEATARQRIDALEKQLAAATERVQELESSRVDHVIAASLGVDHHEDQRQRDRERASETELLRQENALLLERVAEVEQQFESLSRECERYEDVAALAASQAHALSQRLNAATSARDDREQQLVTLQRASEDHAIVAQLQLQLAHVTSTYQLFARRYDDAVDAQQRATLRQQQLEMALELQAKDASARDEQQRERVVRLERAVACVRERDWSSRNAAWDAFKRRLDALEREMLAAQERRRALEQELQDKQLSLAMAATETKGGGDREVVGTTAAPH
ncbi:hypothetical protein PINS_up010933 [Pythium insidiosum]|nr:hypothetical protein PINS_up010933 [Pythium insidiosum]